MGGRTLSLFPATLDNIIVYKIDVTNRGPSLATNVNFTFDMSPQLANSGEPAKEIQFLCDSDTNDSCVTNTSLCDQVNSKVTSGNTLSLTCHGPTNDSDVNLNAQEIAVSGVSSRYLFFKPLSIPDSSGEIHKTKVSVSSNEKDNTKKNNTAEEPTAIKVKVDLAVTKDASKAEVRLNEEFQYNITVTNNGPGNSADSKLTDNLPTGIELTGSPVSEQGTCTGLAGETALTCDLATIANGQVVKITVPARVISRPANTNDFINTATVTTSGFDSDNSNDNDTASITLLKSSISGRVFNDLNDNGSQQSALGESGISAVTITLTGTDNDGRDVSKSTNTDTNGDYIFDDIIPGSYQLTQTQPSHFNDGLDSTDGSLIANSRTSDKIS